VPDPKTLGGFFAVMAFTVGANLILKLGARDPKALGCSAGSRRRGSLYSVAAGLFMPFCSAECRSTSLKCLHRRSLSGSLSLPAWCSVNRFRPRAGWESPASASGSRWLVGATMNV
jgi:hypothetical protein